MSDFEAGWTDERIHVIVKSCIHQHPQSKKMSGNTTLKVGHPLLINMGKTTNSGKSFFLVRVQIDRLWIPLKNQWKFNEIQSLSPVLVLNLMNPSFFRKGAHDNYLGVTNLLSGIARPVFGLWVLINTNLIISVNPFISSTCLKIASENGYFGWLSNWSVVMSCSRHPSSIRQGTHVPDIDAGIPAAGYNDAITKAKFGASGKV